VYTERRRTGSFSRSPLTSPKHHHEVTVVRQKTPSPTRRKQPHSMKFNVRFPTLANRPLPVKAYALVPL